MTFPLQLPIAQDGVSQLLYRLEAELPPQPRAWTLCETYLAYFTWWFRPIKRDELINDVLSPIYKFSSEPTGPDGYRNGIRSPHLLAVLYLVFAVGALVDLTLPPCSIEAEKYYRLGRAALSLKSIFDSPNCETIQAISLMSGYHSLCNTRHTAESAWALISLAARLSHSVRHNFSIDRHQRTTDPRVIDASPVHRWDSVRRPTPPQFFPDLTTVHFADRDGSRWGLEPRVVEQRRNLFWEVYLFEVAHVGRLQMCLVGALILGLVQPAWTATRIVTNSYRL